MEPTPVAVVFLRHAGELLLHKGGQSGGWRLPADWCGEGPHETARTVIEDEFQGEEGHAEYVRRGDPFEVSTPAGFADEGSRDTSNRTAVEGPVRIHPFLYDWTGQPLVISDRFGWVPPTALLDDEHSLWQAYDRVRPTIETIESDTEHGSTTLSVRALEVLRDETALLARTESEFPSVEVVVRDLAGVRPTMTAVANRILRAVTTAADRTPGSVSMAAHEGISRAVTADETAASVAAERINGERVASLSRSGTVLRALEDGDPTAVLVAESRPGGEGVGVARQVSEWTDVTLTSDAAFPGQVRAWEADTLLVGADSILADGRVVNKVGTLGAALAATHNDTDVVVVAASDKIDPETGYDPELRDEAEIAGENTVNVHNPTFETVPPDCVDTFATERGVIGTAVIREIAGEHAQWRSLFDSDAGEWP